jgi:hypothetical protein
MYPGFTALTRMRIPGELGREVLHQTSIAPFIAPRKPWKGSGIRLSIPEMATMLAPGRPAHQRRRELGEEHEALHRDGEGLVHLVGLHRHQRHEGRARRVRHHGVEASERLPRALDHLLEGLRLELVRPQDERPPAERGHLRLERASRLLVPPVRRQHVPSLAGEQQADGAADATGASGHQNHPVRHGAFVADRRNPG